jgi:hypothetical protein
MDAKRMVTGTLVGGVALVITGYLIFGLAFADFYLANAGSATGGDRVPVLVWPMVLASLGYAALITYAMGNRVSAPSIGQGAMIGAVVGFLMWFTADFAFYGSTNVANLTRTVVDPLLEIVHGGLGGLAIAAVLSRMSGSDRAAATASPGAGAIAR